MRKERWIIWVTALLLAMGLLLTSCGKDKEKEYEWEWEEEEDAAKKPRFIWIDAAANFPDFANSRENIRRDLALAKDAGFTDVVVDVRPTTGDALFTTDVVAQVQWLGAWRNGVYGKYERTATWDYLQAFIEEGHALGLKVHAGVNTFTGGNGNSLGNQGVLHRESAKKEWATHLLTSTGAVNVMELGNNEKFFNPVREEVQEYLCAMLEDLAAYRDLDGIILDRARFNNLNSDFSPYTRTKFEAFLGYKVLNFPDDVMTFGIKTGSLPATLPVYFKQWLEFRAKTIHDFMGKARSRVKAVNPKISFGVYVGGWYSTYYENGVNWASPDFNTGEKYPQWATATYKKQGYADLMDVILLGAYAAPTRIYGTSEWTVQGFCTRAMELVKGDAPVVGGPDVGNGEWATASDAVVNSAITQSVDAAIHACDGYFLFDMIHLKNKNQWSYVKAGISQAIDK